MLVLQGLAFLLCGRVVHAFYLPLVDIRVSTFLEGVWNRRYGIKPKPAEWGTGDYGTFERVPLGEVRELPADWKGLQLQQGPRLSTEDLERAIQVLEAYTQPERIARLQDVLSKRTNNACVVAENCSNPNNLWAALRTIDSYGIQNVHVIADPERYEKKGRLLTMKSAMGSNKWLTLHGHNSAVEAAQALRAEGYTIFGSALGGGSRPIAEMDFSGKSAIVLGNEAEGLSPEMLAECDEVFHIPMSGFAESFNLSVACTIALTFVMAGGGLHRGDLPSAQQRAIYLRWLLHTVKAGEEILRHAGIALPDSMSLRTEEEGLCGFSTIDS